MGGDDGQLVLVIHHEVGVGEHKDSLHTARQYQLKKKEL